MSIVNPGKLEILLYIGMARTIGHPEFKKFVEGLRIRGAERVMDFGSGPGVIAGMIAKRLASGGGTLACVDISETWIRVAKRRLREYSNIEYMLGDIRTMGIPEGTFDIIAVHYVIHDVDERFRPGVVAALSRALKPDGRIVVDEPRMRGHSLHPDELRRLMADAGLTEVESKKTTLSYVVEFKRGTPNPSPKSLKSSP